MNDGGPAFPAEKVEHGEYMLPASQGGATVIKLQGMTLRDYFAAKAMAALIQSQGIEVRIHTPKGQLILPARDGIPPLAYEYADAMLEARK